MLEEDVLPRLRAATAESAALVSRTLKCWGPGEASVANVLDDLYDSANPSLAYMIKDMEVHVRITAKGETTDQAKTLIAPLEHDIRDRLGDVVFAADDVTVEQLVLDRLQAAGWTVSTLERATQGRIGARLDAADSSGAVFSRTVIPGGSPALPPRGDVIVEVGPIGVSPGDTRTRTVDISVATPVGGAKRTFVFGGNDETVCRFATIAGLHLLRHTLEAGEGQPHL